LRSLLIVTPVALPRTLLAVSLSALMLAAPAVAFTGPEDHDADAHDHGESGHDHGHHDAEHDPLDADHDAAHDDHGAHDHDHEDHAHGHGHGTDTIIVRATRTGRQVQDQPVRVEVINREEIEEKAIMRPGHIATLVNETGGVRVQVTSPALGAANIRLQGLYGRYTQMLSDGLPLYGGPSGSLGLLQIPPTDLAQVEVIKGSASSLYGAAALGGLINLVTRRPGDAPYAEVLVNVTSRNGQDLTSFSSTPVTDSISASLTAGAHRQTDVDLDKDGWIDLPAYERFTARPRLYITGENGAETYLTLGFMTEDREGGTRPGARVPDGAPFPQTQDTRRVDFGLLSDRPLSDSLTLNLRAAAMVQDHDKRFGASVEDDRHQTALLEASLAGAAGQTDWALGLAYQTEAYDSDAFPAFDYDFDVPAVFAEINHDLTETLSVSLSARLEDHSVYGGQTSPRASVLYRPGPWTVRASYGEGYFAPTPFVEEIQSAGLSRLDPVMDLEAETAATASLDIGYAEGPFEAGLTLFASNVDNVTGLEAFASTPGGALDRVRLVNSTGQTEIRGSELLLRYFWRDFKFTGSYLYLDAREDNPDGPGHRTLGLTPEHSAGFVAMWERHGEGRVGFEAYYTGEQTVYDNPFITETESYWHLGLLGEIVINNTSFFLNFENLLDVRQTDEHPLVRPAQSASGAWTTDVWQNTDGFIVNGGIRFRFGG